MFLTLRDKDKLGKLCAIFEDFAFADFQSLAEQFDKDFEARYNKFWMENRKGQKTLLEMNQRVDPSSMRLQFDMAVCSAVGMSLPKEKLLDLYTVIVNEMIITRGLKKDWLTCPCLSPEPRDVWHLHQGYNMKRCHNGSLGSVNDIRHHTDITKRIATYPIQN